jgi:hypothetical protein
MAVICHDPCSLWYLHLLTVLLHLMLRHRHRHGAHGRAGTWACMDQIMI